MYYSNITFFFSTGVSLSVTVYTWNNVWDMEVTKDTDHSIGYSSKYAESGMLGGQMWALNLMGSMCGDLELRPPHQTTGENIIATSTRVGASLPVWQFCMLVFHCGILGIQFRSSGLDPSYFSH